MQTARIGMILLLSMALSPIAGTPAMGLGDEGLAPSEKEA